MRTRMVLLVTRAAGEPYTTTMAATVWVIHILGTRIAIQTQMEPWAQGTLWMKILVVFA